MSDAMIVFGGLLVVFVGMVAIIGLLYLIAAVTRGVEKAQKKRADKKAEAIAGQASEISANVVNALTAPESPVADSGVSEEELTAIITAAVAAYLEGEGSKEPRFTVTSFKRV